MLVQPAIKLIRTDTTLDLSHYGREVLDVLDSNIYTLSFSNAHVAMG